MRLSSILTKIVSHADAEKGLNRPPENDSAAIASIPSQPRDAHVQDTLTQFRHYVGIHNEPDLVGSNRPVANVGIYQRIVKAERTYKKQYKTYSMAINGALGMQIVFAAALTALGAGNGPRSAVTAFGAINTVLAGFLTYLKGSGLPHRLKYYANEIVKVREYIEQREREFARGDLDIDLREEVKIIENMYENVKRDIEVNTPESYVSITSNTRAPPPSLGNRSRFGAPQERQDLDDWRYNVDEKFGTARRGLESRVSQARLGAESRFSDVQKGFRSQVYETGADLDDRITNIRPGLETRLSQARRGVDAHIATTRDGLTSQYQQAREGANSQYQQTRSRIEDEYQSTRADIGNQLDHTRTDIERQIDQTRLATQAQVENTRHGIESRIHDSQADVAARVEQTRHGMETRMKAVPTALQFDNYLNKYADHFDLRPHLRLSTRIKSVTLNVDKAKWLLEIQPADGHQPVEKLEFDKLIVASGPQSKPIVPDLPGKDDFKGQILHSAAFKDPAIFTGKRVMVVGVGNTAADTVTALVPYANSIYLAHRYGAAVLPRILKNGTCLDHGGTYRLSGIRDTIDAYNMSLGRALADKFIGNIVKSSWGGYEPQWRLTPIPNLAHQVPTASDSLIPLLRAGKIKSVATPKRVIGSNTIELEDSEALHVDVIIWCTGYRPDFSILGEHDPTVVPGTQTHHHSNLPANFSSNPSEHDKCTTTLRNITPTQATPLLYQNIFSLAHPQILAFIGLALVPPAFVAADLSSMAIAQLWSSSPTSPSLPPSQDMYTWYQNHILWSNAVRAASPTGRFLSLSVRNGPWLAWVQDVIGANVDENLGLFSAQGWTFWWREREFCKVLMDGVLSPHVFRLFESGGRRRSWDGARREIEDMNRRVGRLVEERRRRMEEGGGEIGNAIGTEREGQVVAGFAASD